MLDDGAIFEGESWACSGETFGEAVFATAMTGYQETLTDPSYHKQVVIMTAPHIGNTGMNKTDEESRKIWVSGFVVRNPSPTVSSWRSERSLEDELIDNGIVGIKSVDTRAITRHLRDRGAMRVGIFSEGLLSREEMVPSKTVKKFTVAAIDMGIKGATPRLMAERGIEVHVFPVTAKLEDLLAISPDGIFLSNGPGDPSTMTETIVLVREILSRKIPLFGICFGHQIIGRALGFDTYKLPFGHRGINQPVKNLQSGKVEITAHNHGFAVDAPLEGNFNTVYGAGFVSHKCLNDNVVEGLELLETPAFSVQYHPEAAAGPHDASYLFDQFITLMDRNRP